MTITLLKRLFSALAAFALSGCQLGTWEDFAHPPSAQNIAVVPDAQQRITLTNPIKAAFAAGDKRVAGGRGTHTLLAGEYTYYGRSDTGFFFRGIKPSLVRSMNFGLAEDGGLYLTADAEHRIAFWLLASEYKQAMVGVAGSGGTTVHDPNYQNHGNLIVWLPESDAAPIRARLLELLKTSDKASTPAP